MTLSRLIPIYLGKPSFIVVNPNFSEDMIQDNRFKFGNKEKLATNIGLLLKETEKKEI